MGRQRMVVCPHMRSVIVVFELICSLPNSSKVVLEVQSFLAPHAYPCLTFVTSFKCSFAVLIVLL